MLVGTGIRKCMEDGFWSGSTPTCKCKLKIGIYLSGNLFYFLKCFFKDVDCGGLPDIEHGSVRLESGRTTHGAVAIYTCHENYTLIGKEKRTCSDGGFWSEQSPQCLRKYIKNLF